MFRENAIVLAKRPLNKDHYLLTLKAPRTASEGRPGQFAELDTKRATLLRKPISIANLDAEKGEVTFVFRTVGKGTKALSELEAGQDLDLIGPLGNGFTPTGKPALLIGGGVGTPPMWFLASRLKGRVETKVVLGARSAEDLILREEFAALGLEPIAATDDGSLGVKGTVIDAILGSGLPLGETEAYACGPLPMLKALAELAEKRGFSLQVSLEAYMGCGVGVCVGCVVPTSAGMLRVCKEGPVFNSKEIIWSKIR